MSKKNKAKSNNTLSPEAYIRQRARTLPIYECYITENWEEDKIATVVVSRKHTNGNITFAVYLTDLLCLGVKDSFYRFNETERKFREIIENFNDNHEMEKIDYPLAHNIILAANEFAEDYDLHPCKEFTKVTQYMLEEDTDDIELMEIECGMDGKPAVVFGHHNKTEGTRILNHLHKTVGEGNYHFIQEIGGDEDEDEDEDWDEESEDEDWEDEEIEDFDNLREKFFELIEKIETEKPSMEDLDEVSQVSTKILRHYADYNKFLEYVEFFNNELNIDVVVEPDAEIFGIDPNDPKLLKKCLASLNDVLRKYMPNDINRVSKSMKKLSKLPENIRHLPFFELVADFLTKNMIDLENNQKLREEYMLDSFTSKFPIHPISKVIETKKKLIRLLETDSRIIVPLFKVSDFFGDRKKMHLFEFKYFFSLYEFYIIVKKDLEMLCAIEEVITGEDDNLLIVPQLSLSYLNLKLMLIKEKLDME